MILKKARTKILNIPQKLISNTGGCENKLNACIHKHQLVFTKETLFFSSKIVWSLVTLGALLRFLWEIIQYMNCGTTKGHFAQERNLQRDWTFIRSFSKEPLLKGQSKEKRGCRQPDWQQLLSWVIFNYAAHTVIMPMLTKSIFTSAYSLLANLIP
jgi:hypothetical protein